MKSAIQKATLSKEEVKKYLGIGDKKLLRLLINPNFPKPKPVIEKWSKYEVDNWLNGAEKEEQNKQESWSDYIG